MIEYLHTRNLIYTRSSMQGNSRPFKLLPDGYARIDFLQKNSTNGNNVLVAMKFGEETMLLRENIRKGISEAGYISIFIDEVQYNDLLPLNY